MARRLAEAPQPDLSGQRLQEVVWLSSRKRHEHHTVGELVGDHVGHLDRQPRLADPTRTGQRHQPDALAGDEVGQLGQLVPAADELTRRPRQPHAPTIEAGHRPLRRRPGRREPLGQQHGEVLREQ